MLKQIIPGLWRFRLWTSTECRAVLRQIDEQRKPDDDGPNTMNRYGVSLGGPMRLQLSLLSRFHVQPLAPAGVRLLMHPSAFAIDYTPKTQRSSARHVDDSVMTLNVCLGHRFKGGDLVFYPEDGDPVTVKQRPGFALVHAGSLEHRALPITEGSRTNLVLWCRARKRRL